jgi:hypothetical protein
MFGFLRKLRANRAFNPIQNATSHVQSQYEALHQLQQYNKQMARRMQNMPNVDDDIMQLLQRNQDLLNR